jgi:hypothetical protein
MEKQLNRTGWQELTDQQLVVQARLGDRHAFGELVQRHHAAIYRVCYRILFNVEDACALRAFLTQPDVAAVLLAADLEHQEHKRLFHADPANQ